MLPDVNFNGYCLIHNTISIPGKVINLYIPYTLNPWIRNSNTDVTRNNCLFEYVEPTKNFDLDNYKYRVYGLRFDSRSELSFTDESVGKNVINFGTVWAHLYILIIKIKIY